MQEEANKRRKKKSRIKTRNRFRFVFALVSGLMCCAHQPPKQNSKNNRPKVFVKSQPTNPKKTRKSKIPKDVIISKEEALRFLRSKKTPFEDIIEIDATERLKQLKRTYTGTEIEQTLDAIPPFVVMGLIKEKKVNVDGMRVTLAESGRYYVNSNLIVVSGKTEDVILHELMHYVGWLGRGSQIDYVSQDPSASKEINGWLEEGMATLFACRMAKAGCEKTLEAYEFESQLCICIEVLAGREVLEEAYLSGDFRKVQKSVDEKLGKGTFERMLSFKDDLDSAYFLLRKNRLAGSPGPLFESKQTDRMTIEALERIKRLRTSLILKEYRKKWGFHYSTRFKIKK